MAKQLIGWVAVWALVMGITAPDACSQNTKTDANIGLSLTRGNSETLNVNASLITETETRATGSLRAGVETNYGEARIEERRDTTVENTRGFFHLRQSLTHRAFTSLDGTVYRDDIAQVDYRAVLGPALGVYAIKQEQVSLSIETGLAYLWEKVARVRNDFMTARLAERLIWELGPHARLWQSADALPKADDFGRFLLKMEVGVEAAVNTRVRLRIVWQNTYDSQPALEARKNDLSLIAGIGIGLN